MKHLFIILMTILLLGCVAQEPETYKNVDINILSSGGFKPNETENFTCIKDYNNLNYTTLGISREEFKKLECYRQLDWLRGGCFPSDCKEKNPPICTTYYAIFCFNSDTPESKYFMHIYINKSINESMTLLFNES